MKSCFPIFGRSYWFVSSYLMLLITIPILNYLYENFIEKYPIFLLIGVAIFSILPTLTFNGNLLGSSKLVYYVFKILLWGPIWFMFLYLVIKFLKKRCRNLKLFNRSNRFYFVAWGWCSIFMLMVEIVMYYYGQNGNDFCLKIFSTIRDMQSIPCILGAAFFFLMFKNLYIPYNSSINYIASATFGIFLLHNHESSILIFWKKLFNLTVVSKEWYFIPYSLLLLICIFCVGIIIIEFFRKKVEKILFQNLKIIQLSDNIDDRLNR
ncbi:Uncharacterised protein [Streptococcus equinus]|nr:Uncharacterised protein [Streptococcus equinus]